MANFTKKRLKTSKELVKDLQKGDLSITKNKFSIEQTVGTVKLATETYVQLMNKVDELKEVNNRVFSKNDDSMS